MLRRFGLLITGLLLAGVALFAEKLGLDYAPGLGRGRFFLLVVGLILMLGSLFFAKLETLGEAFRKRAFERVQQEPIRSWLESHPAVVDSARMAWKYRFLIPAIGLVLFLYVWIASVGLWTTWPARSRYYSQLAQGFLNHELSLPVEPSRRLLALSDPYDPVQRTGIKVPLDYSLYNGKFYLYWGPVPALILAALHPLIPKDLPDMYLVFGFMGGLFLLQTLLAVIIWDRYYPGLPKWIMGMLILLTGLSVPSVWMLGRGEIYEAAIISGQFFVIAGFSVALSAVVAPTSSTDLKLLLVGACWSLAIGSRLTLILPISFVMLMVLYKLGVAGSSNLANLLKKTLYLGLPILIGLALLAWYNWARFGSFSETGFTYQLAGIYLQDHLHEVMSYRYFVQNLYNYFLATPEIHAQFPFIFSNGGSIHSVLPFLELPEFYNTNPITGLVYSMPFMFFSLLGFFRNHTSLQQAHEPDSQWIWLVRTLAGSIFIALVFLLIFFWAAMRYVLDFMPMLMLLSIIGYCQAYTSAKTRGFKKFFVIAGPLLAGLSIVLGILLGVSASFRLFQNKNPMLLNWLIELFG